MIGEMRVEADALRRDIIDLERYISDAPWYHREHADYRYSTATQLHHMGHALAALTRRIELHSEGPSYDEDDIIT